MPDEIGSKQGRSLYLSEYFMAAMCVVVVIASFASLYLSFDEGDSFGTFETLTRIVMAVAIVLTFRTYKWDVTKGLLGGALFCLMYLWGYLVLGVLWAEESFDAYLIAGIPGSIYLAASSMSFLMIIIITVNHFFISYAKHGNQKNMMLNRIAIIFELAVCALLLASNALLNFPGEVIWKNGLQLVANIALLLLIVSVDSQFNYFKVTSYELGALAREEGQVQ